MKWRCFFADTFMEVEAPNEEQAKIIAACKLVEEIEPESFTVWELNPSSTSKVINE